MYNSDDYKRHIINKIRIDLSKRRPNYFKPIICMFMKYSESAKHDHRYEKMMSQFQVGQFVCCHL